MTATRLSAAETTLSINKGMECTFKVLFSKIGPKNIRKVKFGVGNLPQQKVTYAMFPPCPYNQIHGCQFIHADLLTQRLFINLVGS